MKCTYCRDKTAFWRPVDLADERRACEWCILYAVDRDEFMWIVEASPGGRWYSLQELEPLKYASVTRARIV